MKRITFLLLVMNICLASGVSKGVEIIAHRGASFDAPENTIASFKLGYQQKADADELDIWLTQDKQLVVFHDADTRRFGGDTNKLANQTLEQLRRLDVGTWGDWKGKGFSEKMPILAEVLPLVPDGRKLFIEIKCGEEILPHLKTVLERGGKKPEQTVLIGFGLETMKQAKAKLPKLAAFWLVGADRKTKQYPPVDELIRKTKAAGLDGLDLEKGFPIDAAFVRQLHQAGLKLYTWTVDDVNTAREETSAGVDGITTNRPQWLREQLGLRSE